MASEDQIHRSVVQFLRVKLPNAIIHHSANQVQRGGRGGMIEVVKKKNMGMMPGFPDLVIFHAGRVGFIEVKAPKKYPTQTQREVGLELQAQGHIWMVCRSIDDAEEFVSQIKTGKARPWC